MIVVWVTGSLATCGMLLALGALSHSPPLGVIQCLAVGLAATLSAVIPEPGPSLLFGVFGGFVFVSNPHGQFGAALLVALVVVSLTTSLRRASHGYDATARTLLVSAGWLATIWLGFEPFWPMPRVGALAIPISVAMAVYGAWQEKNNLRWLVAVQSGSVDDWQLRPGGHTDRSARTFFFERIPFAAVRPLQLTFHGAGYRDTGRTYALTTYPTVPAFVAIIGIALAKGCFRALRGLVALALLFLLVMYLVPVRGTPDHLPAPPNGGPTIAPH